jgi:peptide/nickel transport system substrate-binding protein
LSFSPSFVCRWCSFALAAFALAACAPAGRGAAERGTPPTPAAVVVGIAQPRRGVAPDAGIAGVAGLLQSAGLVAIDPAGRAQPALADRWEATDAVTWRFRVRPGLTFHDGTPLTAAEIRDFLSPGGAIGGPNVPPGLRDVTSVEAPSPDALIVRLRQPSSLLLEALALLPVRGGRNGASGAGPFVLESSEPGRAALRAFDEYYRGSPSVRRVELRSFPTQRATWVAAMRGDVDVMYEVAPEATAFVNASAATRAFSFLRPYVYFMGFNLAHPILARREVRVAINRAIDRQLVIRRSLGGQGVVASGHVWPRHWAYDGLVAPPAFDPALAIRTLEAAGLPVGESGRAAGRGPSRFRVAALLPADYPVLERIALVIQKQLSEVGIDLALEPVPELELRQRLATGRFEAYINEMAAGQGLNWPYWFWHTPPGEMAWVRSGYAATDAALDAVVAARTDDQVRGAVSTFQRTLIADPPGVFLCWSEISRGVARRFAVPPERDRDVMGTLPQWRLAMEKP